MARLQGIRIGFTVVALIFALLTVNTLSAAAGVPVSVSSSGLGSTDQVEETAGEFQDPGVSGVGSEDPGFFGVVTGVTSTVQQLITLTTGVTGWLEQFAVPPVMGLSIQAMIDLTMGWGIVQLLLRFKG